MKCNIIVKIIVIGMLSSMMIGSTSSFAEDLTTEETKIEITGESSEEENTDDYMEEIEEENQEEENLAGASNQKTGVSYKTHVQTYGWQDYVSNGEMSGTEGEAKRLEGIQIKLENQEYTGSIQYRTHVQTYGWQDYVSDDAMSGTEGEAKRLEAIQIELTGEMAEHYDIYYRVHSQTYGWLGWAKNGEKAGSSNYAKRLEGIQIVLVEKGGEAPGTTDGAYRHPWIGYNTHVQTFGWQGYKFDGETAGTSGLSKRLEGIQLKLIDQTYEGSLQYRTHVQTYGWQDWTADDAISGTTGEAKRLEAIQIQLTGEMAEHFDVYYRVHSQTYGWLGWAKNGESAGTEGCAKRLEAIEVLLVEKGNEIPSGGGDAFYNPTDTDANVTDTDSNAADMDSNPSEKNSDTEDACSKGQHVWGHISWDIKNGYACGFCYKDVTDYEDMYDCHGAWHTHTFYYMPEYWVCQKCGKYLHKHYWKCFGPTWSLDGTKIVEEPYWECALCGNQSTQIGTVEAIKVSSEGYKYGAIDHWVTPYNFENDSYDWIFENHWDEADYTKKLKNVSIDQSVSLTVGDSYSYKVSYIPGGTENQVTKMTWESSDPSIVSVDENGKIVAKKNGVATITVTASKERGACKCKSTVRVTDTNIGSVKKATLLIDGKSNPEGTITLSKNKKYSLSLKTEPGQAVYEVRYDYEIEKKSPITISGSILIGNISIDSWASNPKYTNPESEITTLRTGKETVKATVRDIMGNVIELEQKIIVE